MSEKLRLSLFVVVVMVSLAGILFLSFRDLDQAVSFQLSPREIDIVVAGEINSPTTDYVVNGGIKSFFQEPVNQIVVGRYGNNDSHELGLIGFSQNPGKTYFAKEELGWSVFQRIDQITKGSQTLTITLGKDEVMTLVICIAIFFAGFVLTWIIFKVKVES